ncbi:MAG: DUF1015 family protein [Phycisphaerae bacterium]
MPEIQPFSAIRYDFERSGGNLTDLIAPPYDVLDQDDKDRLLAASKHNVVAVDLPHVPPKAAGPDAVYQQAAHQLEAWLAEGALVRDAEPAVYLYHQTFTHAGQSYTRRKFFARVRLTEFSEGQVLPHEKTFGGPKEDRLALMKATKSQLSPIFGLFSDPEDAVNKAFEATAARTPDATGSLDGTDNRLWIVRDDATIGQLQQILADKKVYIADGHHRYGTALLYRNWYREAFADTFSDSHPSNYCMFVLASMDDPGCLILPYYRTVAGVDRESLLGIWSDGVETCDAGEADAILHDGKTGTETPVKYAQRQKLHDLEAGQVEPWYDLDYAYLHRYLIEDRLAGASGQTPDIKYVKSEEDAKKVAAETGGTALLVNATPMAHLQAMSLAGGLMPQKSTYFHPKIATGLAINPLA